MSALTTLARPYAKAAFQLAEKEGNLRRWDGSLALAAGIVSDESVANLIDSPHISAAQARDLVKDAGGDQFDGGFADFLTVLSENGRLLLLDEIASIYSKLRQEAEKRLVVRVVSAVALQDEQENRLREALSKRFDADIELNNEIDQSVIGGAVIYAGDQVIDGSLLGRLKKLEQSLAS